MNFKNCIATAILFSACSSVQASGPQPPKHSQMNYSFTCPSGDSGHMSYTSDFTDKSSNQLKMWVNGKYIQDDPKLVTALHGKEIQQMQGGCDGKRTTVLLRVFDSTAAKENQDSWITVLVDNVGQITWVGF